MFKLSFKNLSLFQSTRYSKCAVGGKTHERVDYDKLKLGFFPVNVRILTQLSMLRWIILIIQKYDEVCIAGIPILQYCKKIILIMISYMYLIHRYIHLPRRRKCRRECVAILQLFSYCSLLYFNLIPFIIHVCLSQAPRKRPWQVLRREYMWSRAWHVI